MNKKIQNNHLVLLILAMTFISISLTAQNLIDTSFLFVYAKSGLKLRSEPNLKSETLALVAYSEAVQPIREIDAFYSRIENRRGKWLEVNYQGQIGYMFSGFLSKLPRPDISQNTQKEDFLYSQINQYFTNHLHQVSEKDTIIINGCEGDPDCRNGAEQVRYELSNNFTAIEHFSYESYTKEIIGIGWAFEDAKDIVETLISFFPKKDAVTITNDEGWVRYVHQGKIYYTTIFIKRIDELTTSISYDSYP